MFGYRDKTTSVIGFLLLCAVGSTAYPASRYGAHEILPNWATPDELRRQMTSRPPLFLRELPQGDFRIPAEFEPTKAVVMTWTGFQDMLTKISLGVAQAGAQVWMVGGPTSMQGLSPELYRVYDFSYDSVWMRDYGPFGIREETGMLGVVDAVYRHFQTRVNDDRIPCAIAAEEQASCYSTSLILDGGNFLTDGRGGLFMTRRTYAWNKHLSEDEVNQLLRDTYNIDFIHVFDYAALPTGEPADGTGHIDMFVKLLDVCKVLVAECDQSPFQKPLDDAAAYFSTLECMPERMYEVYRIPGWKSGGTWYTYTNSLMVNNRVLAPGYLHGDDEKAKAVYQAALPDHTIEMIESDSIIKLGGSVHCVTMQIPETGVPVECKNPQDCSLDHVERHGCVSGRCVIEACQAGYANCNDDTRDGCEIQLGTLLDCMGCNDSCDEGEDCQLRSYGYECKAPCQPVDEICNQMDDDCDGEIDEEGVCETDQGAESHGCGPMGAGGSMSIFFFFVAGWTVVRSRRINKPRWLG